MKHYVDDYVCLVGVQSWCRQSSLSVSDWAAWIQAAGAIMAILAAGYFVRLQIKGQAENDRRLQEAIKRDLQISEAIKALIILQIYLDFADDMDDHFNRQPKLLSVPQWVHPGNSWEVPAHLDSLALAFLVHSNNYILFKEIQSIDLAAKNLQSALKDRADILRSESTRRRFFEFHEKNSRQALPHEWEAVLGQPTFVMIVRGSNIVGILAEDLLKRVSEWLPKTSSTFKTMFPDVNFQEFNL